MESLLEVCVILALKWRQRGLVHKDSSNPELPRSSGSVWNLLAVSRHLDAFNIIPFPSSVVVDVQVLFQQRSVTC